VSPRQAAALVAGTAALIAWGIALALAIATQDWRLLGALMLGVVVVMLMLFGLWHRNGR
jgi:hypothetical protein